MAQFELVAEGLKKKILKAGSGVKPVRGNSITVNCTGSLAGDPPKKFWRFVEKRAGMLNVLLFKLLVEECDLCGTSAERSYIN